MNYRTLGSSDLVVSEIGFGAWQLANPAWGMSDEDEALRLVHTALEGGCTFFDTAPGYGEGRSETVLGRALRPVRDRVVICSKFGHTADGESDFSVAALRPAIEASLARLQTDHLDVLLVHNPPAELLDGNRTPLYAELDHLKQQGLLRAYGVSIDWARDLEQVVRTTGSRVVEVLFNAFHQEPGTAFAAAQRRGVGLIAKVPLDSGWLSGKYRRGSRFEGIRDRWTPEVIERRAALVEQLAARLPADLPLPLAALRFILAHPEISTVIPGAKTTAQVRANLAASEASLPADLVAAIRDLWARELEADPLPW